MAIETADGVDRPHGEIRLQSVQTAAVFDVCCFDDGRARPQVPACPWLAERQLARSTAPAAASPSGIVAGMIGRGSSGGTPMMRRLCFAMMQPRFGVGPFDANFFHGALGPERRREWPLAMCHVLLFTVERWSQGLGQRQVVQLELAVGFAGFPVGGFGISENLIHERLERVPPLIGLARAMRSGASVAIGALSAKERLLKNKIERRLPSGIDGYEVAGGRVARQGLTDADLSPAAGDEELFEINLIEPGRRVPKRRVERRNIGAERVDQVEVWRK